jgi:acetyl/propionyl-CoA carboxylase alpha subunit
MQVGGIATNLPLHRRIVRDDDFIAAGVDIHHLERWLQRRSACSGPRADMNNHQASISVLGTSALLFEAPGEMALESQQRIWALAREAEGWPEVREAVPGMNNLMLSFASAPAQLGDLEARLHAAWLAAEAVRRSKAASSNCP